MAREFTFKNVVLIKLYIFILVGLFIGGPIIFILLTYIPDSTSGMLFATMVGFAAMFFIFKSMSKEVVISFDTTHIYFTVNKKPQQYLKSDLLGFYSFNYLQTSNCTISMCFCFINGRKIDISDYAYNAARFDAEKHQMLSDFIKTAEHELGFQPVSKSKGRTIGEIGNVWFSKPE